MKKKIPLQILEILEPFVLSNSSLFESIDPKECLLKFKDKDAQSDFFFNVEQYKIGNELQLLIDRKPSSNLSIENKRDWIDSKHLEIFFARWVEILEKYSNVKTVFDDPIIEAFANEYYTEFEIIEDDAETKPFSTRQILLLDEHLENIETEIEKYQTEENKKEIQEIKDEVVKLRSNLTTKSKKWIIQNLSKTWAKITKQGPKFIKEFLSEGKKEAIKVGVKMLIEGGIDLLKS